MTALKGKEILLGISAGIAAYKSAMLCSDLIKQGAGVTVMMSKNAVNFVAPLTFSTLTSRPVYVDMWDKQIYDPEHISLTDKADLVVVAPATANIIAKMANGICDDLISTTLCGTACGVLLVPAMNTRMYNNPATQRNLATLANDGIQFIGPGCGRLACGSEGVGRMAEPGEILQKIIELMAD